MRFLTALSALLLFVACQPKATETVVSQQAEVKKEEPKVIQDTMRRAQSIKLPTTMPVEAKLEGIDTEGEIMMGQRLYSNKCGTCHQLMPVKDFSADKWKKIVPDMAKKAKLDASQENLILKYVLSEVGG